MHPLPTRVVFAIAVALLPTALISAQDSADPHLWLEEIDSERALSWVRERNESSSAELIGREFGPLEERLLGILDSEEKIPYVSKIGPHYYNLWTDREHPRGIWRRTTPQDYASVEPQWETVLDIDALGRKEGESWVWKGATVLRPAADRALIRLSRGGADAVVVREFDLGSKQFVEDGFVLPEAKSRVSWRDESSLWIGTDFGAGTLTNSGYPRTVRLWRRGTPLSEAAIVQEGEMEDVSISAQRLTTPGHEQDVLYRAITFWTSELSVLRDGDWIRVEKPLDAVPGIHRQWLFLELRSDWKVGATTFSAGSLLVTDLNQHLAGRGEFRVLFEPSERVSLVGYAPTRNHVLLTLLDNVRSRIVALTPERDGSWSRSTLPGLPAIGQISVRAVDADVSDEYFLSVTGFLTPPSLFAGSVGAAAPARLKTTPEFFNTNGLLVEQREAVSADGTVVPYFEVRSADARFDGNMPTLLYAYGGFEIAMTPRYSALSGAAWLERGGAYVLANIRGGGEFGPQWHQAALKENRPRAYEDMAAVAQDLIRRRLTRPQRLAVMGGSNGGLMVGNMITRYPALFGAAVCQVPLLDMRRYHKLLAGASWMAEYGDPDDPAQWAYIRTFSPYHNVSPEVEYPRTLFITSTRDDRVHPGHARKMMAKMEAQEHDVLYYENIEGGHGGAADSRQQAHMNALTYSFLWQALEAAD